jgi:hypothetical protein
MVKQLKCIYQAPESILYVLPPELVMVILVQYHTVVYKTPFPILWRRYFFV